MIKLNDLSIGYSKNRPLREHLNYKFENSITGILAESGAGKSTLFKTICGLIKPLHGTVEVNGKIVKSVETSGVTMMCQKNSNFDWRTCIDNILIVDEVKHRKITNDSRKAALDMLDKVGLKQYANNYPRSLSGGEQQRLALARILYMNPSVLLMDEPLSALDDSTRKIMQDLIIKQHKDLNNTILLVTHSPAEAIYMCDEKINF